MAGIGRHMAVVVGRLPVGRALERDIGVATMPRH